MIVNDILVVVIMECLMTTEEAFNLALNEQTRNHDLKQEGLSPACDGVKSKRGKVSRFQWLRQRINKCLKEGKNSKPR